MTSTPRPAGKEGLRALLAVTALAFALRVSILLAVGFNPAFFDADEYHRMAVGALRGHPMDTVGHPPGYSWFLVAVYSVAGLKPRVVYLVQAALAAFAGLLAGAGAGLMAEGVYHLDCPITHPAHVLVWHGSAILLLALLGLALGLAVDRRERGRMEARRAAREGGR